jgi:DNA-binding transcriptional LysR family regulator
VELRHLRYFVCVAEIENVSRAALKLHISQPALSRQIRDLEDELRVVLLERTAKSVSLTEAGRVFLKEARAVLERADQAIRKTQAVAGADIELHVGHSPTPTARLLPVILQAYQRAMPQVRVDVRILIYRNSDISPVLKVESCFSLKELRSASRAGGVRLENRLNESEQMATQESHLSLT